MNTPTIIPIVTENRSCGDCTLCCEGWLVGNVQGHEIYPGRKCHFVDVGKGCTIYDERPEMCQKYECQWLIDKNIPEWLKPNRSDVILKVKEIHGYTYLEVTETGKKIDSEILSWLFSNLVQNVYVNIKYQVNGGWNYFGNPNFLKIIIDYYS